MKIKFNSSKLKLFSLFKYQNHILNAYIYLLSINWHELKVSHKQYLLLKKVANVIVGILMSQKFQFMKTYILNTNRKAVATCFILKNYM